MSWRQMNGRRRTEVDGIMWIPKGPSSDMSCFQVENTGGMTGPTGPINNFGINQNYTSVTYSNRTEPIIQQNTTSSAIFISYFISIPSGTCTFYCDENNPPTTQASISFFNNGTWSGSIVVPASYYYTIDIANTQVSTVTLYILS
jgi:hypothetical protein